MSRCAVEPRSTNCISPRPGVTPRTSTWCSFEPAPIGPTIDRIRAKLDGWLGKPKFVQGEGMRLIYRFESENPPVVRLRLKIETNTREHLAVRGTMKRPFAVESRWWQGRADITTYEIEELLATKLRALFQRRKGRDLFDLCTALEEGIDPTSVVDIFRRVREAWGSSDHARAVRKKPGGQDPRASIHRRHPAAVTARRDIRCRQGDRARPGGNDFTRTRRAVEGKSEVTDPCHDETNRQTSVSKTSPKPGRIPGNSRGVERTQLAAEGVIAEPLTDESRAPSVCWKSGPNESPFGTNLHHNAPFRRIVDL